LVTALNAVVRREGNTVWVASAIEEEDARVSREQEGGPFEIEGLRVALVEHDPVAYDLMYNSFANPLLWFVQHGLYNLPYSPMLDGETRRAWEEGYLPVNRNFARALSDIAGRGEGRPTIMLHDYQLYMTPGFLRERLGEEAVISLFVHVPWPEPHYWSVLPKDMRESLLRSLLEANVLAFHTRRYADNFLRTVSEVLGVEVDLSEGVTRAEREVWARAYPISIDPAEFEGLAESERVQSEEEVVRNLPGRLLLRVDRMDLSKNVLRGFMAYGRMLELYPEMREVVTFFAQLQPSREGVPEYAEYARAVKEAAEKVNERHGTENWRPIVLSMQDNFHRSVAAYKHYDALLVNAVRDGMNLVAKEAAVVNKKDGALILSENAGAYEELGEHALTVNPFDIDEQAETIYRALTMPAEERARRAAALRETVRSNTVEDWAETQMRDISDYRKRFGL
jgi:trehalose 6-phosphate synthase